MPVETIGWKNGKVRYIDQTLLPHKVRFVECADLRKLRRAIRKLEVRGAPAIGIAGALGIALAAKNSGANGSEGLIREVSRAAKYLASSRPTAVNLFWALARMECVAGKCAGKPVPRIKKLLLDEALSIIREDMRSCRRMAGYGAGLVRNGDSILTHCNAGGLATADYGTALGVLFEAKKRGKRIKVYVDETRPLLQGARLTTWELMREGIDTTLICDNMAAGLMAKGKIDRIFVGADRIASNGDAANKIGTYGLAVLAKYHNVPLYVVAPLSTFDLSLKTGADVPIEMRHPDEVRAVMGVQIAPRDVDAYNPAFDVTPSELIAGIVTECGIIRKPYKRGIGRLKAWS